MNEITTLLRAASSGDLQASERVVTLLYGELQRLARSRLRQAGGLTLLETSALVHESYLRIQGAGPLEFVDRKHYLGYAAKVMRAIVIDMVRSRKADRHGGGAMMVTLNTAVGDAVPTPEDEVLRVHEALEELNGVDARLAQVVEMRYFGGLTEAEIGECLGVTERTVQRDWQKARLFLSMALQG